MIKHPPIVAVPRVGTPNTSKIKKEPGRIILRVYVYNYINSTLIPYSTTFSLILWDSNPARKIKFTIIVELSAIACKD